MAKVDKKVDLSNEEFMTMEFGQRELTEFSN